MSQEPLMSLAIHHNMRTQIGIIMGLVDIIGLSDGITGDQSREDLTRIGMAAHCMLDIIEQDERRRPYDRVTTEAPPPVAEARR